MATDTVKEARMENASREDRFLGLYQNHSAELTRFAHRFLGSSDEANDVVQEAFSRIFQRMNAGIEIENPRAWLYRVAANLCRDRQRIRIRWEQKKLWLVPSQETQKQPLEEIIHFRDALEMRRCLARLNPRDRLALLLYAEGLSYADMSDITHISLGSIGMVLSRALARLRKKMHSGVKP